MTTATDTERRLALLEQRLAVTEHLASYAYCLDFGLLDGVGEHFAADAHLDVINFPPGSGEDKSFDGREAIVEFYRPYVVPPAAVRGGHHVTNVVAEEGSDGRIGFSAYFLTSSQRVTWGQGGQYRGEIVHEEGRWRYSRLAVISWIAESQGTPQPTVPLSGLQEHLHPTPVVRHGG